MWRFVVPQISLYIDQNTLEKIEKAAKKNHASVSKWVGSNIKKFLKDDYPEDYFTLFGSIKDDTLHRPEQIPYKNDVKREKI